MKNMELDIVVKQYIIDAICNDGYADSDGICETLTDSKHALQFLYDTFKSEYGWSIERMGEQRAFAGWIMGLPSSFNIDFENYKILELSIQWGSISHSLTGKARERREELILANWFNFIAIKTFQLFKKYKIV